MPSCEGIGKPKVFQRIRSIAVAITYALTAGLAAESLDAATMDESPPAACAARSHADPARLNVTAAPEGYTFMPPCKANVEFYIPRTTSLRTLDGTVRVTDGNGRVLSEQAQRINLQRRDNGMYAATLGLAPVPDRACGMLNARVEITLCLGADESPIECPDIRVKTSEVFGSFDVHGNGLSICRDD